MEWSSEEWHQLEAARVDAEKRGASQLFAVATRAVQLAGARGGTMTAERTAALSRAEVLSTEEVQEVFEHIATLGAQHELAVELGQSMERGYTEAMNRLTEKEAECARLRARVAELERGAGGLYPACRGSV